MRLSSTARRLILAGVSVVVAGALGAAVAAGGASSLNAIGYAPDSATIARLSRERDRTQVSSLSPTLVVTETAAILSDELLIGDLDFKIDMPIVHR